MHWTYRKGAGKIIRQSLESFRAAKATNRSLDSVRIIKMAYQRMENGRVTHEPRESANLKGSCSDGQRLLDQNKLSVTVKVENRTFKIEVKCATVGELVGVLNAKVENYVNGKIVGYKTLEQNLQLDYYLTCAEAEACLLNGSQLVLVPVTQ